MNAVAKARNFTEHEGGGVVDHGCGLGQMDELPGVPISGQTALTMAEYFRDDEHRDVLLLIDNIFRFIQSAWRYPV